MAGTAKNQIRSASVYETTAGTTPTSPSFQTNHVLIDMMATPQNAHQSSLAAGGAMVGVTKLTLPVTGKISNAELVYGVYDEWIASLFQSAWSTDALTDGKGRRTLTVENTLPAGIGGSSKYLRYKGVEAVGGSIMGEAGKGLFINFDLVGMSSSDSASSALSGATYTDPSNKDPMASNFDVGTITFAGYTFDSIQKLEMTFDYVGRDPQPAIGGDTLIGVARGALVPKIKARFYVDTNFTSAYDLARSDHSGFKITVNLGSVTNKKYKFEFWDCSMEVADPDFAGNGSAFIDATFQPLYLAANSGVVTVTRAVA